MHKPILLFLIATLSLAVPEQLDMRVWPSVLKYADYSLAPEGICSGYTWAKELAQIVSNAASFTQKERISLSAQHLLDCTETTEDKCYSSTQGNIIKAMEQTKNKGITTSDCYINRPLQHPAAFCKRVCANGFQFDFTYRANFKKLGSVEEVFQLYRHSDSVTAFAILKIDDSFNFYSSFKNELSTAASEVYEYRIAEIVGWKNSQKKLTLRGGPGLFWGYNGYIDLDLQTYGHYIDSFYSVSLLNNTNMRSADQ